MPNYKIVNTDQLDADLKAVADSIREKSGKSGSLAFPGGFVSAVNGIETGGGGGVVGNCKLRLTIEGYEYHYGEVFLADGKNTSINLDRDNGTTEYEIPCGTVILVYCDFFSYGTNLARLPFDGGGYVAVYQAPAEPDAVATLRVNFSW